MSHRYPVLTVEEWTALLLVGTPPPRPSGSVYCLRCDVRRNTVDCICSQGRTGNAVLLCPGCHRVVWSLPRANKPAHPWAPPRRVTRDKETPS